MRIRFASEPGGSPADESVELCLEPGPQGFVGSVRVVACECRGVEGFAFDFVTDLQEGDEPLARGGEAFDVHPDVASFAVDRARYLEFARGTDSRSAWPRFDFGCLTDPAIGAAEEVGLGREKDFSSEGADTAAGTRWCSSPPGRSTVLGLLDAHCSEWLQSRQLKTIGSARLLPSESTNPR